MLKEKLVNVLGAFGGILYFVISFFLFLFPITIITSTLNLPMWTNFIFATLLLAMPSINTILSIVAFFVALNGPQDIIATAYYIYFGIICVFKIIPFIIAIFSK